MTRIVTLRTLRLLLIVVVSCAIALLHVGPRNAALARALQPAPAAAALDKAPAADATACSVTADSLGDTRACPPPSPPLCRAAHCVLGLSPERPILKEPPFLHLSQQPHEEQSARDLVLTAEPRPPRLQD